MVNDSLVEEITRSLQTVPVICKGLIEYAPYDRIMVTCAARKIPEPLIQQLRLGGKMVIPVGPREHQDLLLVEKDIEGNVATTTMINVRFVEFKGEYS